MMDKIINLLKGEMTLPQILLYKYKALGLTEKELIVLIYIINLKSYNFNPKEISSNLELSLPEVLEVIDSLSTKDFIKIELRKVDNVREEFISLDNFYNKLAYLVINDEEINKSNSSSSNVFDIFEKELGRTLSPMEYEIINGWLDVPFKEELIISALKEATYNGVSNLRYIDKILYEWKKKGINSKEDIEKNRNDFQNRKVESKPLFDYDWLNDNE